MQIKRLLSYMKLDPKKKKEVIIPRTTFWTFPQHVRVDCSTNERANLSLQLLIL